MVKYITNPIKYLILLLILNSCKVTDFQRKQDLYSYMSKIQNIDITTGKHSVFIFQIGICGACTEENKNLTLDYITNTNNTSYIILSHPDQKALEFFNRDEKKINLLVDSNNGIHRYGLRFPEDLFILIQNGEIKKSIFLNKKSLKKLKRYNNKAIQKNQKV